VPQLAELKQETVEGFVKRDFALYEPLEELPFEAGAGAVGRDVASRCKLTRVNDEVVVLKVASMLGLTLGLTLGLIGRRSLWWVGCSTCEGSLGSWRGSSTSMCSGRGQ
jgi:hypothetical protein